MSVTERIKEIQQAQIEKAYRESLERAAEAERINLIETALKQEEQKRQELIRQKVNVVLGESGVLEMLQNIEKEFLENNYKFHSIVDADVVHAGWANEGMGVILKWNDSVENPDHEFLMVLVNLDTETLTIKGKDEVSLVKSDWSRNTDLVERSIAEAFLNHGKYFADRGQPNYGISGSN